MQCKTQVFIYFFTLLCNFLEIISYPDLEIWKSVYLDQGDPILFWENQHKVRWVTRSWIEKHEISQFQIIQIQLFEQLAPVL